MADEFDFIVIGAGPSGCAIASRLANTSAQPLVLLIEAGGPNDDTAHLLAAQRFDVAFREGSPLNWSFKTEPQLNGQKIDYPRGKGLGGSTAINFCGWVVGADDDYDEWARRAGDEAFSWKNVKECLKKVENFHNDVPQSYHKWFKPRDEDHGIGGIIDVSHQETWLNTCEDVFVAAEQTGFGVNPDVNNGNPIGMGIGTVCIYDGIRITASSAYLNTTPSNLTILVNKQVGKVIVENDIAVGVEAIDGHVLKARKDIVLSAGALNSPQILLLSGVGPREQLEKHGIPVVKDLRQVGENLQDHCLSTAGVVVKKADDQSFSQSPTPMGWFKVPAVHESQEFGELPADVQQYLNRPHVPDWELAALTPLHNAAPLEPDEEIFSCICMLMNPQSRGVVTLQSSDPRDAPLIDPRFLRHPFDRRNAIESTREMLRYMKAPVWKQKTIRTLGWPTDGSDEAIWGTFSSNMKSSSHMCGTVRMGKDHEACVDASFKVSGIQKLRVADMSVCPLIPNNHTQTTAYIIGELAAEKLVAEHGLSSH